MNKVWCVLSKDGWCATKDNIIPAEDAPSAPTICNFFVILGLGVALREPTCEDCLQILLKNPINVN